MHDLDSAGVPLVGVRVVDGSGLSRSDRVTARELGTLLTLIWNEPAMRGIVWRSLATAGVNGTLAHRLQYRPARGLVHAKTGTTDVASALSGYVGSRYAFVVLQNGYPVNGVAAHHAQDRFVRTLAARARVPAGPLAGRSG
jgi:D-alanyl-D-alanine carboxypeptidase/D-alanyl-D-alanine-endopeptidase (penicillin-binding protein 4)